MPSNKKVALVTGATRGIGFETARQLGQKGITVVVGGRTQQDATEAAGKLVAEGLEAYPLGVDITKDADRKAAASFVAEKFGKLDILINNAGVGGEGGLLNPHTIETTQEELESVFNTNLFSLVAITRDFLPLLKKSPAGRIVNLGSIVGSLTLQAMPQSPIAPFKAFAYNASKTALNQFTVHLAAELQGTNIKVNSAHPGWVKTNSARSTPGWRLLTEPGRASSLRSSIRTAPMGSLSTSAKNSHGKNISPESPGWDKASPANLD